MRSVVLLLAGIGAMLAIAVFFYPQPAPCECDRVKASPASEVRPPPPVREPPPQPTIEILGDTLYGYCADNGTLSPALTDGEGYFGCTHSSSVTVNITFVISYPTTTYYDLQLSWVQQQIVDGIVYIYDDVSILESTSEMNDPPPSDVYTCYSGTCYVQFLFLTTEGGGLPTLPNRTWKMYYSLYDPYTWPPPYYKGDDPAPRRNPNNTASSFLHCDESQVVVVNGIPAGRIGCAGYEPNVKVTWLIDTQISNSKESVLYNMTQWAYNEAPYTVKAYQGHAPLTDKSKPIKADKDGFGFLKGTKFTVVFNSGETTNDPKLPRILGSGPPKPGFFSRFSAYTKGSKLDGYCG